MRIPNQEEDDRSGILAEVNNPVDFGKVTGVIHSPSVSQSR